MSKFEDGFVVFHVKKIANGETKTPDTYPKVREELKNRTLPNKLNVFYNQGDLIVRDESNHIEMITKLIKLLGKQDIANFLKVVEEPTAAGNNGTANKNNPSSEYS